MKKPRIIKQGFFIVFLFMLLIWAMLATSSFLNTLTRIERDSINKNLSDTAISNAAQVRFVLERYRSTLTALAISVEKFSDFKSDEALDFLQDVAQREGYARFAIDCIDGSIYTSDGFVFKDRSLPYFDKIVQGDPFVADIVDAFADNDPLVSVLIPLRDDDGAYRSALRASMTTQKMTETFDETFLSNGGYYHLIDSNGRYIAAGSSPDALLMDISFFDALDQLEFESGFSAEQIKSSFTSQQSGFSKYTLDGQQRYAYYQPVGVNNWVLMMMAPRDLLNARTILHQKNSMVLCAHLAVIFSLILCYVYVAQNSAKKQALLHERCFEVLAKQTGRIIFEWDFVLNKITSLGNFRTIFGRDVLTKSSAQEALTVQAVHPDDRAIFESVFATIQQGEPVNNARFRILDSDNNYRWSSLSGLVVTDQKGRALKAIGSLESIDDQVRTEHDLRQKAEKDSLTNLYNKATTEYLIKGALAAHNSDTDRFALLIIDVDNFKGVNDTFGHLHGDIVLASLAESLRQIFRSNDIIGRIGGDEFFVFLQNFGSMQILQAKATEIGRRFRNVYLENGVSTQISASIGIALCPEHGVDFDTLYKHTDIALYAAKAKGKDTYCIYDGTASIDYQASRTAIDTQGSVQKSFKENRIEYIFKLLYGATDPASAIQSTLELLAAHFDFTRSYILEFDKDCAYATSDFAWHGVENKPAHDYAQKLRISEFDFYTTPLLESDIFLLEDSHTLPEGPARVHSMENNIRSMIQCAIKDHGRLIGVIRFDDCIRPRVFSPTETEEISTLCHLLSTFLIKHRGSERALRARSAIEFFLSSATHHAYVISPDSYTVLYENKSVVEARGKSALGAHCYQVYRANSAPCADCPMHRLSDSVPQCAIDTSHAELGTIMCCEAQWMDWSDDQRVCLITSANTTSDDHTQAAT